VAHGLPRPGDGTDPATSARGLPGAAIAAIGSFAPSKLPQFADQASGLGLVDDGLLPVGRQRGLNGVTEHTVSLVRGVLPDIGSHYRSRRFRYGYHRGSHAKPV
jgi:hypothetical protein